MKKNLMMVAMMLSLTSFAMAKENTSPDAQAVNAACMQDAATAGCNADKVGTGLLKCLHAYKKSHPEAKVMDNCRAAMKEMRKNKKAAK